MDNFSLIKQLSESPTESVGKLPKGIPYQQYELLIDGKDQIVNIPLRESHNFEQTVTDMDTQLTTRTLTTLLRQFRGIRS